MGKNKKEYQGNTMMLENKKNVCFSGKESGVCKMRWGIYISFWTLVKITIWGKSEIKILDFSDGMSDRYIITKKDEKHFGRKQYEEFYGRTCKGEIYEERNLCQ